MSQFASPSPAHLEWSDCEIGVIIHHDMQVYDPDYQFRKDYAYQPSPNLFNPSALNTDQWLETAKSLGAEYAVLVAKHCSGFSLWPTDVHEYSVASSPWKNGKGDVVSDFLQSCKKYGIRPGLYASCGCNAFLKVDNYKIMDPQKNTAEYWHFYVESVKRQLCELWSRYGKLFEVWFDGGCFPGESAGCEIAEQLARLQPDAVVFQGDPQLNSSLRWIGNERAVAPDPCYSRSNMGTASDGIAEGVFQERYHGCPDGKFWTPGEADMPNRDQMAAHQGGWFWHPGEDDLIYPPEELLERYFTSVGRNCNFLLGMCIDSRGLVPESDVRQFAETGKLIRNLYRTCVAKTSGNGMVFDLVQEKDLPVNMICIMEDLRNGENVEFFTLSGFDGRHYHTLVTGNHIGHKFLQKLRNVKFQSYRLKIHGCRKNTIPVIRECSLWN